MGRNLSPGENLLPTQSLRWHHPWVPGKGGGTESLGTRRRWPIHSQRWSPLPGVWAGHLHTGHIQHMPYLSSQLFKALAWVNPSFAYSDQAAVCVLGLSSLVGLASWRFSSGSGPQQMFRVYLGCSGHWGQSPEPSNQRPHHPQGVWWGRWTVSIYKRTERVTNCDNATIGKEQDAMRKSNWELSGVI